MALPRQKTHASPFFQNHSFLWISSNPPLKKPRISNIWKNCSILGRISVHTRPLYIIHILYEAVKIRISRLILFAEKYKAKTGFCFLFFVLSIPRINQSKKASCLPSWKINVRNVHFMKRFCGIFAMSFEGENKRLNDGERIHILFRSFRRSLFHVHKQAYKSIVCVSAWYSVPIIWVASVIYVFMRGRIHFTYTLT